MNSERCIAHLDMDAFFASVELLHYPALKGYPVVVGGRGGGVPAPAIGGEWRYPRLRNYAGRGVVTTSTYEARALGVFSGMGLMRSAQLAPDAILLPANFDAYREFSKRFKSVVSCIAPAIEDRGIDEIYIDFSDLPGTPEGIAQTIQAAVLSETGLTCSIGVAPNKLLAKIASDLNKPYGLTVISMADIPTRIWPLSVGRINGIGPQSVGRLARLGIHKIGELAATPLHRLVECFGLRAGQWLARAAQGVDEHPLQLKTVSKSLSRETTFERDLHPRLNRAELTGLYEGLCQRLSEDLTRKGFLCRTLGVKVRYADFQVVTRDLTLARPIASAADLLAAGREGLRRIPMTQKIRLIGVRAGGLVTTQVNPDDIQPVQAELAF